MTSLEYRSASFENAVFTAFNKHAGAPRIESKQYVLNIIRNEYPLHHVTVVDSSSCSLLDFAAAGKAKVECEAADEMFNATRGWKPVGSGVEKKTHPGKLADEYHFAR